MIRSIKVPTERECKTSELGSCSILTRRETTGVALASKAKGRQQQKRYLSLIGQEKRREEKRREEKRSRDLESTKGQKCEQTSRRVRHFMHSRQKRKRALMQRYRYLLHNIIYLLQTNEARYKEQKGSRASRQLTNTSRLATVTKATTISIYIYLWIWYIFIRLYNKYRCDTVQSVHIEEQCCTSELVHRERSAAQVPHIGGARLKFFPCIEWVFAALQHCSIARHASEEKVK